MLVARTPVRPQGAIPVTPTCLLSCRVTTPVSEPCTVLHASTRKYPALLFWLLSLLLPSWPLSHMENWHQVFLWRVCQLLPLFPEDPCQKLNASLWLHFSGQLTVLLQCLTLYFSCFYSWIIPPYEQVSFLGTVTWISLFSGKWIPKHRNIGAHWVSTHVYVNVYICMHIYVCIYTHVFGCVHVFQQRGKVVCYGLVGGRADGYFWQALWWYLLPNWVTLGSLTHSFTYSKIIYCVPTLNQGTMSYPGDTIIRHINVIEELTVKWGVRQVKRQFPSSVVSWRRCGQDTMIARYRVHLTQPQGSEGQESFRQGFLPRKISAPNL